MLGKLIALLVVASVATEIQAQSVILPLCGNFHEIYMYYVHISVGTPGNDFTVTVDTGRCVVNFLDSIYLKTKYRNMTKLPK
jgi:hypothetical protein